MKKSLSCLLVCTLAAQTALADETGVWQGNAALSLSRSAGNTSATTLSAAVDEARTTAENKISAYFSALYGKSQGAKSADKARLGGRYDHNVSENAFAYGQADLERDSLANLQLRSSLGSGLGYHVIRNDETTFDVLGGLSYSQSDLIVGNTSSGGEILLGEESSHRLNDTTRFKQKFSYYPNLQHSGQFRSLFDASLTVDLNSTMGLSVSLQNKYQSEVAPGVKYSDTLLLTGVNFKL